MNRRQFSLALAAGTAVGVPGLALADPGPALAAAVAGPQRTQQNTVRDLWRKPLEALSFWGVAPGQMMIEISPGTGYWTEILAPYAKATGGRYMTTAGPGSSAFKARFADEAVFGTVEYTAFSQTSGPLAPAGTADWLLTARNIHDWMWVPGYLDKALKDFREVLKVGGILAIEDHRSDPRPMVPEARDGYVSTEFMIRTVSQAGFRLHSASELGANPRDTKDHPFGVWTLPPTRRNRTAEKPTPPDFDPAKYEAIGESDRMTLRFVKA